MRLLLCVFPLLCVSASQEVQDRHDLFKTQVSPLLSTRCVTCHGPDKQKGALRLDSRAAMIKGGDSGPAVVPGEPGKSLLIQAVRQTHPEIKMPPKEKLTDAQLAALDRWVTEGAVWPEPAVRAAPAPGRKLGDAWSDAENPIRKIFAGKRLDLWSFRKIDRPEPPPARAGGPVDRFILAGLEKVGLAPSPEADRATLIRRLSFDVTGLPPTPGDVKAFVEDAGADAYERLVDRLLASPRHGERWARHWLDLVRYADTNGFERDEFRPLMHRYRDYVIRSFNADKPFDQFIREQLAGDQMQAAPPNTPEEADRLIATGFLRLGTFDSTVALFEEQAKGRNELMGDIVNTTGSAFLGMTFACANCHDHKYDPISQADHFRMRAFFAAVERKDDTIINLAPEQERIGKLDRELAAQVKERTARLAAIQEPVRQRIADARRAGFPAEIQELLKTPEKDRGSEAKTKLKPFLEKLKVSDKDVLTLLDEPQEEELPKLNREIAELNGRRPAYTFALTMKDGASAPPTHVFHQGDITEPREQVAPGFLSIFDPNPADIAAGRRTALAAWIASPENPFTARVIVNRLWHHYFGRGIVATPNDFGHSGARPTHPELLDWLASELIRAKWSLRHIHRTLLLSSAYRQSSRVAGAGRTKDPENLLYWRQNPRRLEGESIRDAMLAVSGRMLPKDSGAPLWPAVPQELLDGQPGILETKSDKGARDRLQEWYTDPEEKTDVRTLFLIQKRALAVPFLEPFDIPDMTVSCGRRDVTVVAPQALNLLNSPFTERISVAFAERVSREAGDDREAQVRRAFLLALGRPPVPREVAAGLKALERLSLRDLCRALLNVNEFVYVD